MVPVVATDVASFGAAVAEALDAVVQCSVVGVYFVGSVALGGYVPGESDIDILAVCTDALDAAAKEAVATAVVRRAAGCPSRGLEFTLYRKEAVAAVTRDAGFEVNANDGPRMEEAVHLRQEDEPAFWYVLDRAVAHRSGVVIIGPPADEVIADIPRSVVLAAMVDSMRWHRVHEKATLYSVLNASRAWRFAEEDVLGSKLAGAEWARARWREPGLIDSAVALRHGRPAQLASREVEEFLDHVEATVVMAAASEGFRPPR
jgi:hypothetical protein